MEVKIDRLDHQGRGIAILDKVPENKYWMQQSFITSHFGVMWDRYSICAVKANEHNNTNISYFVNTKLSPTIHNINIPIIARGAAIQIILDGFLWKNIPKIGVNIIYKAVINPALPEDIPSIPFCWRIEATIKIKPDIKPYLTVFMLYALYSAKDKSLYTPFFLSIALKTKTAGINAIPPIKYLIPLKVNAPIEDVAADLCDTNAIPQMTAVASKNNTFFICFLFILIIVL